MKEQEDSCRAASWFGLYNKVRPVGAGSAATAAHMCSLASSASTTFRFRVSVASAGAGCLAMAINWGLQDCREMGGRSATAAAWPARVCQGDLG